MIKELKAAGFKPQATSSVYLPEARGALFGLTELKQLLSFSFYLLSLLLLSVVVTLRGYGLEKSASRSLGSTYVVLTSSK